jgi:hypothetical protein
LADGTDFPTGCGEIALGAHQDLARPAQRPDPSGLVRRPGRGQRLVPTGSRASHRYWPAPRVGSAPSNFVDHLDPVDADQAQEIVKDPYVFDFLDLAERSRKRAIETALTERLQDTLAELGPGFAFVGRQVPFTVDGDEFFVDCSDSRIIPIDAGRALWRRDSASVVGITARDCWLASDEWPTSRSSRCDRCVALSRSVGDLTWEGRDDGASDVRVGGWGAGGIPQRRAERCIAQVSQELLRDRAQVLRCAQHRGVRRADSGHVPG